MDGRTIDTLGASPLALDLRRKDRQAAARRITSHAQWLPPDDAALLYAVYHTGQPVSELARIAGVSAKALRTRVRRLAERVLSARFLFVTRHLPAWGPTRRKVARACFVQGLSMREAAEKHALSLHTVRRHHAAIEALCEAVGA